MLRIPCAVKVNYIWETYTRTNTKGSEFSVMTTFLVKPLHLPTK